MKKKSKVEEVLIVPHTQANSEENPPTKKRNISSGKIYFQNNSLTNIASARFAVFPEDINKEEIYKLLTKAWLQHPIMLISIIGGKKEKQLDDKLVQKVKYGFEKVLDTHAAWVITDGTKKGMLKDIISDITESEENTVIGISSWKKIKNRESLKERIDKKKDDYFYKSSNAKSNETEQYLDSNHSHFLFVNNNTDEEEEKDLSSIFRSNLESFIIEKENGLSAVILLLGGGINELLYVYNKSPKMPVVLLKGTGGITDILCYVIENMEEVFQKEDGLTLPDILSDQLKNIGGNDSTKMISECVSHKELFSIFDFDKKDEEGSPISNSFEDVLLRSLILKSNKETYNKVEQCVFWNRTDIMKEIDISQFTGEILDNLVIMAVALNQVKFVEALFDQGDFDERLFDEECIAFLYGFRSQDKTSILKNLQGFQEPWRNITIKGIDNTKEVYKYLCRLRNYKYDEHIFIHYDDVLLLFKTYTKVFHATTCVKSHFAMNNSTKDGNIEGNQNIYQVLLIWAVINNMHAMALFFWKLCDNRLPCAIVAAEINKAIGIESKKLRLNIGFCNKYFDNAEKWKQTALRMVEQHFVVGFDEARHILTKPFCDCPKENRYSIHQTKTSMELAYRSNFEELIALNAVQQILSDMWTNRLTKYSILQVFAISLFGPLIIHALMVRDIFYNIYVHTFEETRITKMERKEEMHRRGKQRIDYFLISRTPLVKFYSNTVKFIIFLFVLARECINKRTENYITPWEYVLLLFVVSYSLEEIHQVFILYQQSYQKFFFRRVYQSTKLHFESLWNIMDIVAIVLFYIALGLRIHKETNRYGIVLYGIDAWFWILRVLYIFYADHILGPYVIVIGKMCADIVKFMTILLVFIVAYGVTSTTIIRPKETSYLWLRDVFFQPYFNIYGELFIEGNKEEGKTRFGSDEVDGYSEPLAIFFLGIYLLIANVLLLNLLIAIFGNTFGKIQAKSDRLWKFNRYAFIYGYIHSPKVGWLTSINCIVAFLIWVFGKCFKKKNNTDPEKQKVDYDQALLYRKLQTKIVTRIINEMNVSEESTNESNYIRV